MDKLVCDNEGLMNTRIRADFAIQDMGSQNITLDQMAGVAINGVPIYSGVQEDETDAIYPKTWAGRQPGNKVSNTTQMNPVNLDRCLGTID